MNGICAGEAKVLRCRVCTGDAEVAEEFEDGTESLFFVLTLERSVDVNYEHGETNENPCCLLSVV